MYLSPKDIERKYMELPTSGMTTLEFIAQIRQNDLKALQEWAKENKHVDESDNFIIYFDDLITYLSLNQ